MSLKMKERQDGILLKDFTVPSTMGGERRERMENFRDKEKYEN